MYLTLMKRDLTFKMFKVDINEIIKESELR